MTDRPGESRVFRIAAPDTGGLSLPTLAGVAANTGRPPADHLQTDAGLMLISQRTPKLCEQRRFHIRNAGCNRLKSFAHHFHFFMPI